MLTTINAGLLSFGMSGKVFHAPFLNAHKGFTLKAVVERSRKEAQSIYPEVISYDSVDEIFADTDIQLLVVNTPTDTHFDFAKKALEAGKHVLVEKAFTTTSKEAEILRDLAIERGLTVTVYQNRRWDSDFKTVKKVLEEKLLGDIVETEIRYDRYSPLLSAKAWKETKNAGAGLLLDLGSHIIDQALNLYGMPEAVFADIRRLRANSLIDDNIDILLYYKDKRVRLHAGLFNRKQLPAYVLQGTKGSFFKLRGDVQEDVLKTGASPDAADWGIEPQEASGLLHAEKDGLIERQNIPTLAGNYNDIYEGVYQSIVNGKPEIVSAQEGLNTMRVIEAAQKSNDEKMIISIA